MPGDAQGQGLPLPDWAHQAAPKPASGGVQCSKQSQGILEAASLPKHQCLSSALAMASQKGSLPQPCSRKKAPVAPSAARSQLRGVHFGQAANGILTAGWSNKTFAWTTVSGLMQMEAGLAAV